MKDNKINFEDEILNNICQYHSDNSNGYDNLGFNIPDLKECIRQTNQKAREDLIKEIKQTLEEGVKRNGVLPLDWAFDRIDKLNKLKSMKQ